jgi:hypothetical protein
MLEPVQLAHQSGLVQPEGFTEFALDEAGGLIEGAQHDVVAQCKSVLLGHVAGRVAHALSRRMEQPGDLRVDGRSRPDDLGRWPSPTTRSCQHAAIAYWDLLHDTVTSCQPAGTTETEVLGRSAVVWGLVYGMACLAAFRQIPASVPSPPDDLVHAA